MATATDDLVCRGGKSSIKLLFKLTVSCLEQKEAVPNIQRTNRFSSKSFVRTDTTKYILSYSLFNRRFCLKVRFCKVVLKKAESKVKDKISR